MSYSNFARYYDSLTENVDYPRRAAALDKLIRGHHPAAELLLDLACGTGSLSVELSELGYDVTGVDGSAEMLSEAMAKRGDRDILFLHQRMEELDLYGTVDAAVCALDSLNHLPDAASLDRVFGRLRLFVAPGGVFLFDVNSEYKHREILGDNCFLYDLPQVFCAWRNHCREDATVEITLDFFEPGRNGAYRRSGERFWERFCSREELLGLLEPCGFALLEELDGDTFGPLTPSTQRILYLTRRV